MMKSINIKNLVELTCRLYVFIFLNIYGAAKLFGGQFYTPDSIPHEVAVTAIAQVPNFELAWTFMGRSFGYMLFIGLSEIIGAWMLLFRPTKLIGTLMLMVILLNVIVFDVFFLDAYGALCSAVIYFLMLTTILWLNKEVVFSVFDKLTNIERSDLQVNKRIVYFALSLVLMGLVFAFDQTLVNWFGHGKG